MARAAVIVPIALAALELSHPTWADNSLAQAVASAGGWWIPLHVLLIVGYGVLVLVLWRATSAPWRATSAPPATHLAPPATLAPPAIAEQSPTLAPSALWLLAAFGVCNTAYLAVDGIAVGVLAHTDAAAAEALWNGPLVALLANATGATWSAALLVSAASFGRTDRPGLVASIGLVVTWLAFLATATPFTLAAPLARAAALATGAWAVYQRGRQAIPFALFIFAAVLRQHAGPEAALGLACIAAALALRG